MRGEVATINKIVVSCLTSRDLAWTNKWYSRCRRSHTVDTLAVMLLLVACTDSSSRLSVYVDLLYLVECWLLCIEFELIVIIKDDSIVHNNIHWCFGGTHTRTHSLSLFLSTYIQVIISIRGVMKYVQFKVSKFKYIKC